MLGLDPEVEKLCGIKPGFLIGKVVKHSSVKCVSKAALTYTIARRCACPLFA